MSSDLALLVPSFYFVLAAIVRKNDSWLYASLVYATFVGRFGLDILGFSLLVPMAALVLVNELLRIRKHQSFEPSTPFGVVEFSLIALFLWALAATVFRPSTRETFAFVVLFGVTGPYFLGRYRSASISVLPVLLAGTLGGLLAALSVILQYHISPSLWGIAEGLEFRPRRPSGISGNPNSAVLYVLMGVSCVYAISALRSARSNAGRLAWICIAGSMYAVSITQSRSGAVATLLTIVLGVTARSVWRLRSGYRSVVPLIFGLFAAPFAFWNAALLSSLTFGQRVDATVGQTQIWSQYIELFSDSPLVGISTDSLSAAPHNAWLFFAVFYGLVGGFVFLVATSALALRAMKGAFIAASAPAVAAAMLIVGSFFIGSTHDVIVRASGLWLLLGLLIGRKSRVAMHRSFFSSQFETAPKTPRS